MAATITVAEINRLHARFWSEKTAKLEAFLTETILRERVFEALKGEIARGVPHGSRHSVEGQFEEFSALRQEVRRSDGAKGGRPRRGDRLQRFIEDLVRVNPKLTEERLKSRIEASLPGDHLISDIEGDEFTYLDDQDRPRQMRFSTLRTRLSRAKQKCRSQKPVTIHS